MNINEEIKSYIYSKNINGALLLTGKWGCGKTFIINEICKEVNDDNKKSDAERKVIIFVSLFGIDSIAALDNALKMKWFLAKTNLNENVVKLAGKLKGPMGGLLAKFDTLTKGISGKIGTAISINPLDFVQLSNRTYNEKEESNDELVFVFDDFERCRIAMVDLLGKINEYLEIEKIKTIIIADEDKIKGEEYNEFKEKVIARTIKLIPDYENTIKKIISNHIETVEGYKQFLTDRLDIIIGVFNNSESENLRILKTILIDFERIYRIIWPMQLPEGAMENALQRFGSKVYSLRSPKKEEKDDESKEETDFFKEVISVPTAAIDQWASSGIWDEQLLRYEFEKRFFTESMQDDQRFLHAMFWSLNDSIVQKGFPIVIKKAYDGELSSEDIICLIENIYYLRKIECPLPTEVDYERIDTALDERIRKIRSGEIEEPTNHRFIDNDVLRKMDPMAQSIYKKAISIHDCLVKWDNRRKYIYVMNEHMTSKINALRGLSYEEYDLEMMEAFFKWYSCADNITKSDLAIMLCNTYYMEINTSNENREVSITYQNLKELYRRIEDLMKAEHDSFAKRIHYSFCNKLASLLADE